MPRLGDFEAWVEVDGERLEEYPMVESGAKELAVQCWITSEEGKNFVVYLKDHKAARAIKAVAHVGTLGEQPHHRRPRWHTRSSYIRDSDIGHRGHALSVCQSNPYRG
ncbi:hypothetical protein CALCODRAFT_272263 [Calocera cornea HHB12733]|uniref:Uncharacterized protein n=1 Tax=Calocera cornea HHB12733 TaxID=1353952 RepID=A0A165G5Z8_9BASI|nr:hypothetical protein CALCODRAFT_272263 [Calocera cornea HHB12733]